MRIEDAVLDVAADSVRPEPVVDVVLRVVQRRLTTAERLRACLATRRAHPWRGLLLDVLADSSSGAQTPFERRWCTTSSERTACRSARSITPTTMAGAVIETWSTCPVAWSANLTDGRRIRLTNDSETGGGTTESR
jgi:hypothetical protein